MKYKNRNNYITDIYVIFTNIIILNIFVYFPIVNIIYKYITLPVCKDAHIREQLSFEGEPQFV